MLPIRTVLFLLLATHGAVASDAPIPDNNVLVLRQIEPFVKPFSFTQGNQSAGILYLFGRAIAERLNVNYDMQIHPWPRVQKQLLDGQADIEVVPEFATSLPGRKYLQPPIGSVPFAFYLRRTRAETELTAVPLVGVPKVTVGYFEKRLPDFQLYPYDGFSSGVTLLSNGRLDGLVINQHSFDFLVAEKSVALEDLEHVWTRNMQVYLSVSELSPFNTSEKFRQVVHDVAAEGLFNRLIDDCIPHYKQGQACNP